MTKIHRVTLISGDGIGPEVTEAVKNIFIAAQVPIEWDPQVAGYCAMDEHSTPLPDNTVNSIRKNKIALKGPCTTPVGAGFRSINVELRMKLELFANLRPVKSIPGAKSRYENIDLVVIRENTEGLYRGEESWVGPDKKAAKAVALVTEQASENIVRFAFDYAVAQKRKKVTLVHKANILKMTGGLFLNTGRRIAEIYKDKVAFDDKIIDATCMQLVTNPYAYDVIVTTNIFGDILSDLTAGLIGGLGLAPAANIGKDMAIFEAVHGSAPDIAGQNKANPTALLLSACMMLDHMKLHTHAEAIRKATFGVFKEGKTVTADLGGSATTTEFQDAIIMKL